MERIEPESVRGIACDEDVVAFTIEGLPAAAADGAHLLSGLGAAGIRTLLVVHAHDAPAWTAVVARDDAARADGFLRPFAAERGARLRQDDDIALLAAVGHAVHSHPGTVGRVLEALVAGGVTVRLVASSAISVTCLVPRAEVRRAAALLHDKLGLAPTADTRAR